MKRVKRFLTLIVVKLLQIVGVAIPPIPTVSAIVAENNKILMLNLTYKKGYALPGGGLNANETFEEALHRELKEELGVGINELKYLCTTKSKKRFYYTVHVSYVVTLASLDVYTSEEGSPEWLSFEDALAKCVYSDEFDAIARFIGRS